MWLGQTLMPRDDEDHGKDHPVKPILKSWNRELLGTFKWPWKDSGDFGGTSYKLSGHFMTFWMSFWIFWISFWISLKNHGLVQKTISISHWIFTDSSSHHETSDPTDLRGTGNFRPLFATCQKLLPFPGKLTCDSWILMVFEFLMEFSWMLWMLFVKKSASTLAW